MGDTTARVGTSVGTGYDLVVRPRGALLRSTALSIFFSAVPLGVALVWVSLPVRLWAVVATIVVVLALVIGVVFLRMRAAFVGVGTHRFVLRAVLSPNVTLDRTAVDRIVLATTFGSSIDRTTRELLALGADGRALFRMRGDLWDDGEIGRVAHAFGVRITEVPKPIQLREFYRRYPASRAWYEGRRGFLAVGAVAGLFVLGALVAETSGLLTR